MAREAGETMVTGCKGCVVEGGGESLALVRDATGVCVCISTMTPQGERCG